jgi:hypothetical protein
VVALPYLWSVDGTPGTTLAKVDEHRAANLRCALGFLRLTSGEPELNLLHRWLDSVRPWVDHGRRRAPGLPALAQSHREGEWRAVFMRESPMLAPAGFGVAPTPWRAVQDAAWMAVKQT